MTKTTQELLDMLNAAPTPEIYADAAADNMIKRSLCDYLKELMEERDISTATLVKRSGLDRIYTYQILDGSKHPTRDKVLTLCFTLGLTYDAVQTLLKSTGYPTLYARLERDSVLIFALQRHVSITDVNELLYELNMEPLTKVL